MAELVEDSESEAVLQRHKQEIKDLRAKIQSMKKAVPKGDKKRKKEVTAETARMEQELQERQEEELKSMDTNCVASGTVTEQEEDSMSGDWRGRGKEDEEGWKTVSDDDKPVKKSRAQRRKEKKVQQELEKQRAREKEEREMELVGNPRMRERDSIESLLERLHLSIIDIPPDGNCLYTAIKDQLQRRRNIKCTVTQLRRQCADYVREHSSDFLPFTTDPTTGDPFTSEQFVQYCSDIEKTATWGGDLEIRALSHVYHVTITVYQAESPPIIVGEEYADPVSSPLTLSYHHHEYGLGEHYNSLAPLPR